MTSGCQEDRLILTMKFVGAKRGKTKELHNGSRVYPVKTVKIPSCFHRYHLKQQSDFHLKNHNMEASVTLQMA